MTRNNEISVVKRGNMLPALQSDFQENYVSPFTDVYETPDAYVLMIDLPGAVKEAITVTMENGTLSVRAKTEPHHPVRASMLYWELNATGYYRMFNLGDGIDRNNVEALYENGVLSIRLLKDETAKPKEIRIR